MQRIAPPIPFVISLLSTVSLPLPQGFEVSRREQKREDRRESIKAAAISVFAEKGFHGAKVSEIVEAVGVAQGTFYLYYKSKDQLFGELLDDFLMLVVKTVSNWEPSNLHTREDLRTELTRVGLMLTEVLSENRGLTTIFFKEAHTVSHDFDDKLRDFHETLASMLTTFNEILHRRGLLASMNFRILAFSTIGQVERIIQEGVVHGTLEDVSIPELVEHLVVFYLAGTTDPISTESPLGPFEPES